MKEKVRFYNRTSQDKFASINRCFFEAQNSRLDLALLRIEDLKVEFPQDAQIIYAEGLIRKENLGQGIIARELFEKAYEIDQQHAFAACNATIFARNEAEFSKWAGIALKADSKDHSLVELVRGTKENLKEGVPYGLLLLDAAQQYFEGKEFGVSAAFTEIALQTGEIPPGEISNVSRVRAQNLRSIDAEAHSHRQAIMESFLPDERLALHEAMKELERSISLDEYDAELWNLKSAWCYLLRKYEDAIRYADRAIALRPVDYPKPYHNKASALWMLNRDEEALDCARESLRHAESAGAAFDIKLSRDKIRNYSRNRTSPSWKNLKPLIKHVLNAASILSDQEIAMQAKSAGLAPHRSFFAAVKKILTRAKALPRDWNVGYARLLAELILDFTPETIYKMVFEVSKHSKSIHAHLLTGALFLACHSEGALQRDAARFLTLNMLAAVEGTVIQKTYCEAILKISEEATDKVPQLKAVMRKEFERISPLLAKMIADHPPLDEAEHEDADKNTFSKLGERNTEKTMKVFPNTTHIGMKYGMAFGMAGLVSALSTTYSEVAFWAIFSMAFAAVFLPYTFSMFRGQTGKNAFLKVALKFMALAVWIGFTEPRIFNDLAVWGMIWGMTAVFMINLLNNSINSHENIRKWLVAFLLCWAYAYVIEKGSGYILGRSPYYNETIYYGLYSLFAGLSALTVSSIFIVPLNKKTAIFVLLLSCVGFFVGSLIGAGIIKSLVSFDFEYKYLYLFASLAAYIIPGLFGGFLTGNAISCIKSKG